MRRADRLFQIVLLQRERRVATAGVLAEALGVSRRTIYRDIADLVASGVPVRGEAGVGYALEGGYELPPLTFNHLEIEALMFGARMVGSWGDRELQDAARSAMAKVRAALPPTLKPALTSTALFAPAFHQPPLPAHLTDVRGAIAKCLPVSFTYTDARGVRAGRTVEPVGIYFWGQHWSVGAWCRLREAWRGFRLDRMEDVLIGARPFDPSVHGGLDAFMAQIDRG